MNHRERVLTAVNHQEPDYVPIALWGSAYGITDPLYFDLCKLMNLGQPVEPFRLHRGHTVNYYDDRIMEALDIDVRHADCGFTDLGGPQADGRDCWGIRYERGGIYLTAADHPLENATLDEVEAYPFPEVERFIRRAELVERARFLKEETDYAVVGRAADSFGPFERCCALRGTDTFLMDLGADPDLAQRLIERVTDVLCRLLRLVVDAAGNYLDILELPGDDYAATRPIISPQMFEQFFVPAWQRMIDIVRQRAPRCKILFHSDGNMEPFLGQLADLGVDIFHCLEPMPSLDMAEVKRTYGQRICFWGAIDIKHALQGDLATVEAEVRERIRLLAPGGGYVLAPANHLQPDVPAANVVALFRAARQFGRYPIF